MQLKIRETSQTQAYAMLFHMQNLDLCVCVCVFKLDGIMRREERI